MGYTKEQIKSIRLAEAIARYELTEPLFKKRVDEIRNDPSVQSHFPDIDEIVSDSDDYIHRRLTQMCDDPLAFALLDQARVRVGMKEEREQAILSTQFGHLVGGLTYLVALYTDRPTDEAAIFLEEEAIKKMFPEDSCEFWLGLLLALKTKDILGILNNIGNILTEAKVDLLLKDLPPVAKEGYEIPK